jgi:arylsulfatase A-like enzyme
LLFAVFVADAAISSIAQADERPNVLLFIADDVSWNDYGCYGNQAARTPNIDSLAEHGMRFTEAYLTASSCSPSRSSIVTGRYPHNNGKAAELHLPIAGNLPWFPELLREAGYYTALVGKHHMTVQPIAGEPKRPEPFELVDPGRGPGNGGGHATWVKTVAERPRDKPFFFWFASYDAHRGWDADGQWDAERYGPKHRPEDVIVPPFLVDDEATRQDLASYYNEVTRHDYYIGEVVKELDKQGALDNTLILVMADNGRPFPRAKTRLHDSGMKTVLVAHWPAGIKRGGSSCSSLVSAIDLAPTILSLAGVEAPATMQGVSIKPLFDDPTSSVRKYAFSEHNWHDYEAHGRCVRGEGFLLIRNARPKPAWQGPADSVRSPSHTALQRLERDGKLSPAQADVFLTPRPEIELYRTDQDPHQLHNLAGDAAYADVRKRLLAVLDRWCEETGDSVPDDLSQDSFDRETGKALGNKDYRRTTPGEDREAHRFNAPGPR